MSRMNFTARGIKSLKPSSGRIEYWDESLPGFGLRISEQGKKSWFYFYRMSGRNRRFTLGRYPSMSLAEARQRALNAQFDANRDVDPALKKQSERRAELFTELVAEYLERHAKPKKKSWKEDERILNREFLPLWRHQKAKAITRRDVLLALDKIMERNSPILANRALAVLRKAYNFAIQRDIVDVNPCWNIPSPGKIRTRDRVLTESEIRALWTGLEKEPLEVAAFYKLLLLTAQRSGEIGNAQWEEFDLSAGWWVIPAERSKNGLAHRVPLSNGALRLFKELRLLSGASQWVFPRV